MFCIETWMQNFLYNFFRIVALRSVQCALQKHTIEVIERICGIPGTGVTVTPPDCFFSFPTQSLGSWSKAPGLWWDWATMQSSGAERWLVHLWDVWENDLVALSRKRKMDSLFWQRCSIKGPFIFKWSGQLLPLCSWWRWRDLRVRYHRWSDTLRNKLWYGGSGHTEWVHEIFFRGSRSQKFHCCT